MAESEKGVQKREGGGEGREVKKKKESEFGWCRDNNGKFQRR